jgi:ParB family transcriptional regulator, chromosome partitioning protein
MTNDKKRGLGRGLQDLLSPSDWLKSDDIQLFYCPIDRIVPNPYQPRLVFDDDQFQELVHSVKEKGVLQPILVTRNEAADHYQILAGERRWKAAQQAGLTQVPVVLRETTSAEALEIALIENIQRSDLTCLEEAFAYQRLQEEFDLTQEQIAQRVGKNRSTVANLLRLLQLPPDIQEDILNQRLTMGHARALLALDTPEEQRKARDIIIARHLSVRQTEQLILQQRASQKPQAAPDPTAAQLQARIQSALGARVLLRRNGQAGTIQIAFTCDSELDRLLRVLGVQG